MRLPGIASLGVLVALPRLVTPGSHFIRTVILSHMLSPSDLGVAIAVTVVLSAAALISDFGLDRYLVSRDPSDDAEALAAAHCLQLIRGTAFAILIWLLAPAAAELLGMPGRGADFRWCAVILLTHDLAHLGIRQQQRDLRYKPEAVAVLLARLVALAAVYPAAREFGDYRAMIASLIVDAVVYTVASHTLADTHYRAIPRDCRIWREAVAYSFPLTLNGIGLAASSQLDRALVSHWLGTGTLALYALVLNLAVVPASILGGIMNIVGVSLLAQTRTDDDLLGIRYRAVMWGHVVLALAYALAVATTLQMLAPLVFGPAYQIAGWSVTLISWILAVRIIRGAPTALLLARSQTRQLMLANLCSVTGLMFGCAVLPWAPQIQTMLACVLLGDGLSLAFMLRLVRRVGGAGEHVADRPVQYAAAMAILSPPLLQIALVDASWRLALGCAAMCLVAAYAAIEFRHYLVKAELSAASAPQRP